MSILKYRVEKVDKEDNSEWCEYKYSDCFYNRCLTLIFMFINNVKRGFSSGEIIKDEKQEQEIVEILNRHRN